MLVLMAVCGPGEREMPPHIEHSKRGQQPADTYLVHRGQHPEISRKELVPPEIHGWPSKWSVPAAWPSPHLAVETAGCGGALPAGLIHQRGILNDAGHVLVVERLQSHLRMLPVG